MISRRELLQLSAAFPLMVTPPHSLRNKRGVAVPDWASANPQEMLTAEAKHIAIKNLKAGWFHNYGPTPNGRIYYPWEKRHHDFDPGMWWPFPPNGTEFVPMFLHYSHILQPRLRMLARPWAELAGAIMGPNEPYGEGRTTVEQMLDAWPYFQDLADDCGALIGSPSGGYQPGWFDAFFAGLKQRGLRCDFYCYHWDHFATDPWSAFVNLIDGLAAVAKRYKRPIWVTEVFLGYAPNNIPPKFLPELFKFWDYLIPALEQRWAPTVERLAVWPLGRAPATFKEYAGYELANFDGSLTPIGLNYSTRP